MNSVSVMVVIQFLADTETPRGRRDPSFTNSLDLDDLFCAVYTKRKNGRLHKRTPHPHSEVLIFNDVKVPYDHDLVLVAQLSEYYNMVLFRSGFDATTLSQPAIKDLQFDQSYLSTMPRDLRFTSPPEETPSLYPAGALPFSAVNEATWRSLIILHKVCLILSCLLFIIIYSIILCGSTWTRLRLVLRIALPMSIIATGSFSVVSLT